MLRRSRRLIVAGVTVVGLSTLIPAAPVQAVAAAPCRTDVGVKIEEWSHESLVIGHYVAPGAIDVSLTCGIVQGGQTVTRIPDRGVGPVAVVAQLTNIQGQFYSICHEVVVTYIDDVSYFDTCP